MFECCLGVYRSEVSLLVLVRQADVGAEPVRAVLRHPANTRHVQSLAAALELRPVRLLVAVDLDGLVLQPGVPARVPDVGLVRVVVPPLAAEPFDLPRANLSEQS